MAAEVTGALQEFDLKAMRSSRAHYPGSKAGGRTRYDLPRRRRACDDADDADAILFGSARSQAFANSGAAALKTGPAATPRALLASSGANPGTPRSLGVLGNSGRAVLTMGELQTLELPLISDANDVHGVLVVGGKEAGKTTLVLSLAAAVNGTYPIGPEVKGKREFMPPTGQNYEIPEREIRMADGTCRQMRVLLTDTPPCGTALPEEQPLCQKTSPMSTQPYNVLPSWMRIALRSGNFPHYAVLVVIDASATPIWDDSERCRDLARLLCALRKAQYTVVIAVTKLLKAREDALRDKHVGNPNALDPRNSYEIFAGRYVEKVGVTLQSVARDHDWLPESGGQPFPVPNQTIFDVPTWSSAVVFKQWQSKTATAEPPNMRYVTTQLRRLLTALSARTYRGNA